MASFDPVWETEVYGAGKFPHCPYDYVASFVFRFGPQERPRREVKILEVGCGAGNNVWFLAQEGFCVAGIDGSETAIAYARQRVAKAGLPADLRVGNFLALPFADSEFDLVFDRAALCYTGFSALKNAFGEIHRVLKPSGRFFFNPYSQKHGSYKLGRPGPDRLVLGGMPAAGQTLFCDRTMIDELFAKQWSVLELLHSTVRDELAGVVRVGDWRVTAQKLPPAE